MGQYLAIDIGGTYIKYAFLNHNQQLSNHQKVKTKENTNHEILDQVKQIITDAASGEDINGVGISTAGIVDREKGEIIYAGPTIPNYTGTAFKTVLSESFPFPVFVENDVNAALLGEMWKGAGCGQDDIFCVTLGTGIGGAYYHHQLIDGRHQQANAIGYLLYDEQTKTNYEMRASTAALNDMINNRFDTQTNAEDVFALAKQGDRACVTLITSWARQVAEGLAQIILLLDPKCIIIGGGVSEQGDFLLNIIRNQLTTFLPDHFLKTTLKTAQLVNHAALYGAVYPFFSEGYSSC